MKFRNNVVIKTLGIPTIYSFSDLASKLSISQSTLYTMLNKKWYFYSEKQIPKKDGTNRELRVPMLSLKVVQKWILVEILQKISVSEFSMAFVPKRNGLLASAEMHRKNLFFLEMDIHNFFGNITEQKIYKLFCDMGYNFDVASILTGLCTYDGVLPQGAVTSPYLANLVCFNLDARLNGLCRKRDIVYSRYADDLCFSSNNRTILNKIEPIVEKILLDEGFEANKKKTRYLSDDTRKTIVGITVNNKEIHVAKQLKRRLRAKIYNAISTGNYSMRGEIIGTIAYITSIEKGYKKTILKYIEMITMRETLRDNMKIVEKYNENKFFKESKDMLPLIKEYE